jgi:hypothetical protein
MKVVFAPGALDGVPEEDREELMNEILKAVESGAIFTDSEPVDFDKLAEEDPEAYDAVVSNIEREVVEGEGQTFEVDVKSSAGQTVH